MVRRDFWALIVASMMLLTWAVSGQADILTFPKERKEEQFKFGDLRIVKIYDGTQRGDPYLAVDVYLKDDLKARYPGVSFQHWASSKDYRFFVGVSNFGPDRSAIIVFDSEGSLRGYLPHNTERLFYCDRTASMVREWYDSSNPDIRFERSSAGIPPNITIKSCDGKRISISNLIGADDFRFGSRFRKK